MMNGEHKQLLGWALRAAVALLIAVLSWEFKQMNDDLKALDRRMIEQAKALLELQGTVKALEKQR